MVPVFLLVLFSLFCSYYIPASAPSSEGAINTGDTAWILMSSALVLLMTPGLSLFYGGMVNSRNVISTMLQSFICLGIVSLIWVVVGFSLVFGDSIGGVIGNPMTFFMMNNVSGQTHNALSPTVPFILFAMFQLKFAVITPALITGSFAERVKFKGYMVFISLFILFIYAPLAHMTWHPNGLLKNIGVLDFAGGTVVHMSAGFAALAGAIFFGKRRYNQGHTQTPSNIPYILIGTGILWFGWFGFNAGSALAANELASMSFATTNFAAAAGLMAWIFADMSRGFKPTAVGACIGAVVGLVAITPAAGFVTIGHSVVIGALSAFVSHFFVFLKSKTEIDDTLDVFPCHGIGGVMGMIMTGVFAKDVGLIYGQTKTFYNHCLTVVLVGFFVFSLSYLIFKLVDKFMPLKVSNEEEETGLDVSQHGESISSNN